MKKSFYRTLVVAMLVIVTTAANAQFIVKVRPVAPVIVKTVAPSSRHIWIDGEWVWRSGGYQYVNGYWAAAPMRSSVWVPGHWKQTRRGWMWKPGHWRRRW